MKKLIFSRKFNLDDATRKASKHDNPDSFISGARWQFVKSLEIIDSIVEDYKDLEQELENKDLKEFKALKDANEKLKNALKLTLSFCPKGPVPEGLGPEFYHTLDYDTEVELQKEIDNIRKLLNTN